MDLVAFEFRVFQRRRQANRFSNIVDARRNLERLFFGMSKQFTHHPFDIAVGVVIIIPQNDGIPRLAFARCVPLRRKVPFGLNADRCLFHCLGHCFAHIDHIRLVNYSRRERARSSLHPC